MSSPALLRKQNGGVGGDASNPSKSASPESVQRSKMPIGDDGRRSAVQFFPFPSCRTVCSLRRTSRKRRGGAASWGFIANHAGSSVLFIRFRLVTHVI